MVSERQFRSLGAILGLVASYVLFGLSGRSGILESAIVWATSCVVGGWIGQRLYHWKYR